MLISSPLTYLHKGMRKVINKKATEKCSFLLLLLCAQVFLGELICIVFIIFEFGIKFCVL
jgi:hypothetical protein